MAKRTPKIEDLKPSDLVTRMGVSRSFASQILSGHRKPSLEMAVRIENEMGIPVADWVSAALETQQDAA